MAFLRSLRALLLSIVLFAGQAASAPSEYEIKAVFLLNFSRFVEWPESAFEAPDAPFVLCIYGRDPFGEVLDATVAGEKVGTREVSVRRISDVADASACHILFVHHSEQARLAEILTALDHRSTLTVSDSDRRARRGEMIRLVTDNDRVRLRIDVEAARAAGLTLSSNLLRAAEIVGRSGG